MENGFSDKRESSHFSTQARGQHEDVRGFGEEVSVGEVSVRTAPFGGDCGCTGGPCGAG